MTQIPVLEPQSLVPPCPPDESRHYELIDGEWVERKMGAKASLIGAIVIDLLGDYVKQHGGLVFNSECGYKIFPHDPKLVRYPDASYVKKGRLPNDDPPDGHMVIVPDLVVEVVSPNDLAEEVETRKLDFCRVGVPLIWILYPKTRCVRVIRPGGKATELTEADELSGEDGVPGFSHRVESLFTRK